MNQHYEFGFLDRHAKKEIRRALLKGLAIPGYRVPYSSREMPVSRGFGTGGLQISLSLVGCDDTVKVIDQGSDHSVNAVAMRRFICRMSPGVQETTQTAEATIIQTRHRIPETPLRKGQLMVYQVPIPDCLQHLAHSERERKLMHAEADYTRLFVNLYENLVHFREIRQAANYPVRVNRRYVMDPSPIPRFDNPKLHLSPVPHLFGAGREKRIYAIPPFTHVESLAFDDVPFRVEDFTAPDGSRHRCAACGADDSYLDEFLSDGGETVYRCSDTEYCERRAAEVLA